MLRIYGKFICEIKNTKTKNKIIIGIKITNEIVVVLFVFFAFNNIDIDITIVVNIRIVSDNIEISIYDFKLDFCKLKFYYYNLQMWISYIFSIY